MAQQTYKDVFNFRGHQKFAVTASGVGSPWTTADTSSAGAPTLIGATDGGFAMTHSSDTEVQNLCLYFGDVLSYDIDDLIRAEFVLKVGAATLDSATSVAWGMISARNDAIDSIAEAALFRCIGNNTVVVESDDGTNNNDDVATGLTLGTDYKRFAIDFATGITTVEPPSVSAGGKSNVQFFGSNTNGSLRRVASGTRFNMENYATGLQPFVQIQKTSDSNVDSVNVLQICVEYKLPNYA